MWEGVISCHMKTATNLVPVFESLSMDFTTSINWAQRADGQWFRRYQTRDPRYGYRWTAWQPVANVVLPENMGQTRKMARLPRAEVR